jgi:predicted peroxiredoxin
VPHRPLSSGEQRLQKNISPYVSFDTVLKWPACLLLPNNKMKHAMKQSLSIMVTLLLLCSVVSAQTGLKTETKMKILIHVTIGPENPTRASLAFLVARTAIEEGHTVSMFLAGDAVQLIRDNVLDNLTGLGTGKLREHFDAIVKGGGKIYLSGNSSKARGVVDTDLKDKHAEFALPNVLVKLLTDSERSLVY